MSKEYGYNHVWRQDCVWTIRMLKSSVCVASTLKVLGGVWELFEVLQLRVLSPVPTERRTREVYLGIIGPSRNLAGSTDVLFLKTIAVHFLFALCPLVRAPPSAGVRKATVRNLYNADTSVHAARYFDKKTTAFSCTEAT